MKFSKLLDQMIEEIINEAVADAMKVERDDIIIGGKAFLCNLCHEIFNLRDQVKVSNRHVCKYCKDKVL